MKWGKKTRHSYQSAVNMYAEDLSHEKKVLWRMARLVMKRIARNNKINKARKNK